MCYEKAQNYYLIVPFRYHQHTELSLTAQDERNKNEGALTTQTIERIDGESAAAPPEPPAVARVRRVIRVKMRLQELSDSITQCVEATTGTFPIPCYSSSTLEKRYKQL